MSGPITAVASQRDNRHFDRQRETQEEPRIKLSYIALGEVALLQVPEVLTWSILDKADVGECSVLHAI